METKNGFLEDDNGNKSSMRRNILTYLWAICIPGSIWLLYVLGTGILGGTFSVADGLSLVSAIVVLQMGWIAPKQMAKHSENQLTK